MLCYQIQDRVEFFNAVIKEVSVNTVNSLPEGFVTEMQNYTPSQKTRFSDLIV